MSHDASSPEDSRSAQPESSADARSLRLFPAHVIVFLLLALAAILAGHHAEGAYRAGQEVKAFTVDIRRAVAFGLLFNLAIAIALLVGWLSELVTTLSRVSRKRAAAGRAFARLGLATIPLLVFAIGHALVNPWLPDLLGQVGALARGG